MSYLEVVVMVIVILAVIAIVARLMSNDWIPAIGTVIVLAVFIAAPMLGKTYFGSYYNERVVTCTVTSKDRGGDEGSYRVYTEDCGVFENTDAMFRGKFDSADVWSQIPEEGVVTFRVAGARVPFFSAFPNILEVLEEE